MKPEWKIIAVGSAGVGKTSLILRYVTGRFPASHPLTLSFPIDSKSIRVGGTEATLQIWDTASYQSPETIPGGYYVATRGVILVYDMTRLETFESILPWKRAVDMHLSAETSGYTYPCLLVANKSDLAGKRVVAPEDGLKLAGALSVDYVETSAKSSANVSHVFESLAELIVKHEAAMSDAYDWYRVRDPRTGTTHHAYRHKPAGEYGTECGLTITAKLEGRTQRPDDEIWAIVDRTIDITCDRCLLFLSKHWPIDQPPTSFDL